jgi:hypothetical protein
VSRRSGRVPPPRVSPDAFITQAPDAMLTGLDRPVGDVPPEPKVSAVRAWVEAYRQAVAVGLPIPLQEELKTVRRREHVNEWEALQLYEMVQAQARGAVAKWRQALPRQPRRAKKETRRAARQAASGSLYAALKEALPEMREDRREALVTSNTTRDAVLRREILLAHVGSRLGGVSSSTIRNAVARARARRAHWNRFLRWVARHHPQNRQEFGELVNLLEQWRGVLVGPPGADFYTLYGPLFLDLIRTMRLPTPPDRGRALLERLRSIDFEALPDAWDQEFPRR